MRSSLLSPKLDSSTNRDILITRNINVNYICVPGVKIGSCYNNFKRLPR